MSDCPVSSENPKILIEEIEFSAVRSQGAGGQNVNKTATAIHLRFDIRASSLPVAVKERLLKRADRRITEDGIVVIKAQQYRSQEQNRAAALARLQWLVGAAAHAPRVRKPTRPSRSAVRKRIDSKTRYGTTKRLRGPVNDE